MRLYVDGRNLSEEEENEKMREMCIAIPIAELASIRPYFEELTEEFDSK